MLCNLLVRLLRLLTRFPFYHKNMSQFLQNKVNFKFVFSDMLFPLLVCHMCNIIDVFYRVLGVSVHYTKHIIIKLEM
jgi:hypothetical protein